jgi:hypothetical protein
MLLRNSGVRDMACVLGVGTKTLLRTFAKQGVPIQLKQLF